MAPYLFTELSFARHPDIRRTGGRVAGFVELTKMRQGGAASLCDGAENHR